MTWPSDVVTATQAAFAPLADAGRAVHMRTYMKDIAPFHGIDTKSRRAAQTSAWTVLEQPDDSSDVADAAIALFALDEREYAYAACDLLKRHVKLFDVDFLVDPVEHLLVTKPWWDTVDSLGSGVVSPLCRRYPELRGVVLAWSASGDGWLVRAAIQHQRGWKEATDIPFVLDLCGAHADESWFFIQKAIGWALRDLSALDPSSVRVFIDRHPELTRVAVREAERGLDRLPGNPYECAPNAGRRTQLHPHASDLSTKGRSRSRRPGF